MKFPKDGHMLTMGVMLVILKSPDNNLLCGFLWDSLLILCFSTCLNGSSECSTPLRVISFLSPAHYPATVQGAGW